MTPEERDWEEVARRRLEAAVAARVQHLRQLAAEIEQESAQGISDAIAGRHEWSTYTRVASRMVHDVTWGMANLNLDGVIDVAIETDKARKEKRR